MSGGRYTLYGRPGTGSAAVEALLAMSGLPHDLVDVPVSGNDAGREALLALNPLGLVPVLVLPGGFAITESMAIMLTVAERAALPELMPMAHDDRRAAWLRAFSFLSSTIYPAVLRLYYSDRYTDDDTGGEAVSRAAAGEIRRYWSVLEPWLPDGDKTTIDALDLYVAMMFDWSEDVAAEAARCPRIAATARRVAADARVAPVWERHGVKAIPIA